MVLAGEWDSTSVVVGVLMLVVTLSGCALLRSTSSSCGSQKGSLGVSAFQWCSSGKVNCRASSSPFKPSGHTTMPSSCNSLHICIW